MLLLDLFHVGEEFANVPRLERQVLVVAEHIAFRHKLLLDLRLLFLFARCRVQFDLLGFIEACDNEFDFVTEVQLSGRVCLNLNT